MEKKYTQDAIILCRLIFGQAAMELLSDRQQITNAALEKKIRAMLPDAQPENVYRLAMTLLNCHLH